jgi:hypothetical protein
VPPVPRPAAIFAVLFVAAGACAQAPEPPAPPPVAERLQVHFEPAVWYVSPGGDIRLPGDGADEMDIDDLNLDSPRMSPFGELRLRHGDWSVLFSGAVFEMENRGAVMDEAGQVGSVPFAAGDRLVSSLDLLTFEAAAEYRLYEAPRGPRPSGGFDFEPEWDVMGGMRLYDISAQVSGPGGTAGDDAFFAEPFAGIRFGMELAEAFTVDIHASLGGFADGEDRASLSWDVVTGFQWRPTPHIGVQFGYRQLAFLLEQGPDGDEFKLRGAMAGLYFGGVIRF